MKRFLLGLIAIALTITCCRPEPAPVTKARPAMRHHDTTYIKVVKDLKEVQEQKTEYSYKYDVLNNKFRQQPNVYTETQYYVIYTDGQHDEISRDKWLSYSKGDTIRIVQPIYY